MTATSINSVRSARARLSLDGLSVGDALGERFFSPWVRSMCLPQRLVPEGRWRWTDDTAMALSIVEILEQHDRIEQDQLARRFALRYANDPDRGYGPAQHDLLHAIHRGGDWLSKSREVFRGAGSFGNGAAMRAAPLGAWFADEPALVAEQAALSAEVTHAHADGIAGAIAVAVAAAWAWNRSRCGQSAPATELFEAVLDQVPAGPTRNGIELAARIPLDDWEFDAANALGDGSNITSADTVPFCLWVAARHLDDYPAALWTAIRVHGDIDTNCAIIGGIVALSHGTDSIPAEWLRCRERLR